MAKEKILTGDSYDDPSAEPVKDSFDKIKLMIDEIYEADNKVSAVSFNRPAGSFHNSPDDPYIDTIPISIISSGDHPITGENNDSKNGNVVGVYFKTANTIPAYSGFSNQILKSGELIPNEVCIVWLIFDKTNNIIIQTISTFNPAYILNIRPVITLIGAANVNVVLGDSYNDAGATATDSEDGDITGSIVVSGDTVDVNALGVYIITFNVQDSNGANAIQIIRTVNVVVSASETSAILVIETPPILVVV